MVKTRAVVVYRLGKQGRCGWGGNSFSMFLLYPTLTTLPELKPACKEVKKEENSEVYCTYKCI